MKVKLRGLNQKKNRKNLLRVHSRAFSDKTEQFSRALILISKTQARACAAKTNAAAHTGKNE